MTGGTASYYNPAYGEISNIYEGDPAWNDFRGEQARIGYEFEHRFTDWLTVRQNLRYATVDADLEYSGHYSIGADLPLERYWGHYTEDMQTFVVDNMAEFKFDTGPLKHTAVAGVDYGRTNYDAYSLFAYDFDEVQTAPIPTPMARR